MPVKLFKHIIHNTYMEKISLTFLGTGNAIPTKLRNHPAILLSYKDESILIDCGEATQRQFRYADLSPSKITRILITHWHGDHILGLPGLLQTLSMNNYTKKLAIYGPRGTKHFMNLIIELANVRLDLEIHEISDTRIKIKDFVIETKSMNHGISANAYSFVIEDKVRIDKNKLKKFKIPNSPLIAQLQQGKDIALNGKKILAKNVTYKEKGRKVTFILDTKINENAIKLAKESNVLITESTFSDEEKEKAHEYMHLTASEAATIAKKSNSDQLILTHISQRYEHNLKRIEKEAKKIFKNTKIVKDLDSIEI